MKYNKIINMGVKINGNEKSKRIEAREGIWEEYQ